MAGGFVLLSGQQPDGAGAHVSDVSAGKNNSRDCPLDGSAGMDGEAPVRCAICSDHAADGPGAILGPSRVSPGAVAMEISFRASFGSEHGLDGRGANAFSGNPGAAEYDGDSHVCPRFQPGGDERVRLYGLPLLDICSRQSGLAFSSL